MNLLVQLVDLSALAVPFFELHPGAFPPTCSLLQHLLQRGRKGAVT
jgi:hypothetical protein